MILDQFDQFFLFGNGCMLLFKGGYILIVHVVKKKKDDAEVTKFARFSVFVNIECR